MLSFKSVVTFVMFWVCACTALALLIVALGGCTDDNVNALQGIEDFAAQATVRVDVDGGHGSGVVIAKNRVLTAAHVVADTKHVRVLLSDGTERDANVLWVSHDSMPDTALLDVPTGDIQPATLDCAEPTRGEAVYSFGYPLTAEQVMTWGKVASSVPYSSEAKWAYVLDMTIVPGNSGGGIWGPDGRLVGLADAVLVVPGPLGLSGSITGLSVMVGGPDICGMVTR